MKNKLDIFNEGYDAGQKDFLEILLEVVLTDCDCICSKNHETLTGKHNNPCPYWLVQFMRKAFKEMHRDIEKGESV